MSEELKNLILAIVTSVRDAGSFVTKTKLLKLLYLFDVEYYRVHKKTYTGLDWMYYYLGPWTSQYDPYLETLVASDYLKASGGGRDYDANFYRATSQFDSRNLFETFKDQSIFDNIIRTFATADTPDILNYVYFKTEPMVHGTRNEMLNFSTIEEASSKEYKLTPSGKSKAEIDEFKNRVKQKLEAQKNERKAKENKFTPVKYDEDFYKAMQIMEEFI